MRPIGVSLGRSHIRTMGGTPIMTHGEFSHLLNSLNGLSPEQLRQLRSELDHKLAAAKRSDALPPQGSIGAMRDAADELDEAVEHAMRRREQTGAAEDQEASTEQGF